jgi:inhibitor of KinA sporulation pathway (predicted exonuclease)
MEFEGRPHCGLDDARNIAKILIILAGEGGRLLPNERVTKGGHLRPVIYE